MKITGEPLWDGIGTLSIGILLGLIAPFSCAKMHSLLIGESANEKDRKKIEELIQECKGISQVIEIRTQHLGPEEIYRGKSSFR